MIRMPNFLLIFFTYIKTRIPNGGAPRRAGFKAMPLTLFLDEQPVETVEDMTLNANMKDVAYVKYFPHFAGAPGNGAALAVYTKKGEELLNSLSQMYHTSLVGYTPVKEFYSPNYAEQHAKNFESDLRRTLLWQPNIASDGTSKKITVSFYNNDISHAFQLVLEGISEDGRLIHITKLFK